MRIYFSLLTPQNTPISFPSRYRFPAAIECFRHLEYVATGFVAFVS